MKASAELGIQACQFQHSRRSSYRVKAKTSYVDESLFSSPAKQQTTVVEFDPPWVDNKGSYSRPLLWSPEKAQWELDISPLKATAPANTPRKRNKYRLKRHIPSYCDETLFGSKPGGEAQTAPWMAKADVAKLQSLLWTPPPALKDQPVFSPHPKEMPLKYFHQPSPNLGENVGKRTQGREDHSCKPPEIFSYPGGQDVLGRASSHSDSQLCSTSDKRQPIANKPKADLPNGQRTVSSSPSLSRLCAKSVPGSLSTHLTRAANTCKSKPPWK